MKEKIGLFNSTSHLVVACTAPEIGALKDRPFIPERQLESECSCYRLLLQLTNDYVP